MKMTMTDGAKVMVTKMVKGEEATIMVDLSLLDFTWESLLHSENHRLFAYLETPNCDIRLVTSGQVRVIDHETGSIMKNGQLTPEVLELVKDGSIYDSDRYEVVDNNWFAVEYFVPTSDYAGHEWKLVDDIVYEGEAKDLEMLIAHLEDMVEYFNKAQAS